MHLDGPGSFRDKMIRFIRDNFGDILGEDVALLDQPGGLDKIRSKYSLTRHLSSRR